MQGWGANGPWRSWAFAFHRDGMENGRRGVLGSQFGPQIAVVPAAFGDICGCVLVCASCSWDCESSPQRTHARGRGGRPIRLRSTIGRVLGLVGIGRDGGVASFSHPMVSFASFFSAFSACPPSAPLRLLSYSSSLLIEEVSLCAPSCENAAVVAPRPTPMWHAASGPRKKDGDKSRKGPTDVESSISCTIFGRWCPGQTCNVS